MRGEGGGGGGLWGGSGTHPNTRPPLPSATDKCTVFTWCPLTSGCTGARGALAYTGCQLKIGWATESATSAPHASERGPPTGFTSGRIPGALNAGKKRA